MFIISLIMDSSKQYVISVKTILSFFGLALSVYVVYRLRSILGLALVALLLAIVMESLVKSVMSVTFLNKPLSRGVAVILSYLLFLLLGATFLIVAAPMVVKESQKLVASLSFLLSSLKINEKSLFESLNFLDVLGNVLKSGNFTSLLSGSVLVLSRLVSMIVFSVYISLDWPNIKESFVRLFPPQKSQELREVFYLIEIHMGDWVRGQLTIMFAVGALGFVGLSIAGVDYALALGFMSAIFEIVPILGPFFSTAVATMVGFSQAPAKGLMAFLIFLAIQQVESNFVTPKVMQKFSGFNPLVILLALMIGSEFFGIFGTILAIPVTMILGILYRRYAHFDQPSDK